MAATGVGGGDAVRDADVRSPEAPSIELPFCSRRSVRRAYMKR